ncbi:DUF4386 domain-containing protein [Devosia sp.]|uniref:DUF4386 domain-containing protein n=1 Tax=Devosia sp. TaxID=1871048 RepID=UPI003A953D0B
MKTQLTQTEISMARYAGLLYLIIIVFGIASEAALRGPLVDLANASGTAEAILAAANTYRLSIAADLVMAIADAGLAILLYVLFKPVAPTLALAAMIFRLVQSVLIGANLMNMQAAWLLISGGQDVTALAAGQADALAALFLNLHAHGYDLGLVFFGINSLMTAVLIWRSGLVHRAIGVGVALAGGVYLVGSALHFFAPGAFELFSAAYVIPMIAETVFCLSLLLKGVVRRQHQYA